MRTCAGISTSEIHFINWFQQLGQMPQKCPCPSTNPLAQTVYTLQGGKVHPNFENNKKIFQKKFFLASTTTRKICWIHWWNTFSNPLTIKGDTCNFVVNISEPCDLSMWPPCLVFPIGHNAASTSTSVHWRRHFRPILRTGQHLPCASFSSWHFNLVQRQLRKYQNHLSSEVCAIDKRTCCSILELNG